MTLGLSVFLLVAACDSVTTDESPLGEELTALLVAGAGGQGLAFYTLPSETDYASIPQDPLNPITAEKVALGRLLLHETATGGIPKVVSTQYEFSCASCHPVASSFFAGVRQGVAEGGTGFGIAGEARMPLPSSVYPEDSLDTLPIRVPTLLNVAYQEVALWNGSLGGAGINAPFVNVGSNAADFPENLRGFEGLEVQGMIGQTVHRLLIDEDFADTFGYRALFDAAFPGVSESERYSRMTGGLALAAYNRTLLANQAPWQAWLRGNTSAMTDRQKEGALLFFGEAQCSTCHTGPALKSNAFYAWGMGDFSRRGTIILDRRGFRKDVTRGRGAFTEREEDEYTFKVPTLYNLRDNAFLGHGGTFSTVREVVEYKNAGVPENDRVPRGRLAPQFGATQLSEAEITALTDFVENALYDPNLVRYVPASVPSGFCIPNNDEQSIIDLGCD